jgi:hypothetical protein
MTVLTDTNPQAMAGLLARQLERYRVMIDRYGMLGRALADEEPALRRIQPRIAVLAEEEQDIAQALDAELRTLGAEVPAGGPSAAPAPLAVIDTLRQLLADELYAASAWGTLADVAAAARDDGAVDTLRRWRDIADAHAAYLSRVVSLITANAVLGTPVTLPR